MFKGRTENQNQCLTQSEPQNIELSNNFNCACMIDVAIENEARWGPGLNEANTTKWNNRYNMNSVNEPSM